MTSGLVALVLLVGLAADTGGKAGIDGGTWAVLRPLPALLGVAALTRWLSGRSARAAAAGNALVALSGAVVAGWALLGATTERFGGCSNEVLNVPDCNTTWGERLVVLGAVVGVAAATLLVALWERSPAGAGADRRRAAGARTLVLGVLAVALVSAGLGLAADDGSVSRLRATGEGCADSELQVMRDARAGDRAAVARAVAGGLDVDATDRAGNSPLACAGPWGHVEVVRLLIRAGAEVDRRARDDDSLAADAVLFCQPEVLEELLDAGAPLDAVDRSGSDLLALAIEVADLRTARILVGRGVEPGSWTAVRVLFGSSTEQSSPCPEATGARRSEVLGWLLGQGAPPDRVLDEAVRGDAVGSVGDALAAGADPNLRVTRSVGLTFGLALAGADPDPGPVPVLHNAAVGDADVVEALLAAGADPGAADATGWTALHVAAANGDVEVVRALLAAGAPPAPAGAPLRPSELAEAGDHGEAAAVLAEAEAGR